MRKSHRNVFSVAFSLSVCRLRKGVCGTGGLVRLNAQAVHPVRAESFFAEPRPLNLSGELPSADGRRFAVPTAVGKRVDTCGFYPLNSRFPLFLSLAQTRDRRPLENRGTAEDFSTVGEHSVLPCPELSAVPDTILLHRRFTSAQARHICAAQLVYALLWTATTSLI